MVRCLLTIEDDVENGVEAVLAAERVTKLADAHVEGPSLGALSVEDARDEAAPAEAPRLPGPAGVTLHHLESDSFARHAGREV
jgi:hypothetical protein